MSTVNVPMGISLRGRRYWGAGAVVNRETLHAVARNVLHQESCRTPGPPYIHRDGDFVHRVKVFNLNGEPLTCHFPGC